MNRYEPCALRRVEHREDWPREGDSRHAARDADGGDGHCIARHPTKPATPPGGSASRGFHGSYRALLDDPQIDAVYIPLPNDQHVRWSIEAIEAGKHVLCEKPIGLSAAEARQLLEAAERRPRLKVMEAFKYRHHPQWQKTKEWVADGAIGRLRSIQTFFSFYGDDPADIRNDPAMGGGGMMDIGCYCISMSRWLFAAEPRRVMGIVEYDPRFRVDILASAILDFGDGTATFTCSTRASQFQQVLIVGDRGRIELADMPFSTPKDRSCAVRLFQGRDLSRYEIPACDQFTIQGDRFAHAILTDTPLPAPLVDAVRNMEAIDGIVASGRSNQWIALDGR